MRPLLSKAVPTALVHGPEITVSLNPAGTLAGERFLPKRRPHASTAKPAMALSRLIPEIKPGRSCLRGSCTSQESAIDGGFSLGLYGNCGAKFAALVVFSVIIALHYVPVYEKAAWQWIWDGSKVDSDGFRVYEHAWVPGGFRLPPLIKDVQTPLLVLGVFYAGLFFILGQSGDQKSP